MQAQKEASHKLDPDIKRRVLETVRECLQEEFEESTLSNYVERFLNVLESPASEKQFMRKLRAASRMLITARIPETCLVKVYEQLRKHLLLEGNILLLNHLEIAFKTLYKHYILLHSLERLSDFSVTLESELFSRISKMKELYMQDYRSLIEKLVKEGIKPSKRTESLKVLITELGPYMGESRQFKKLKTLHALYERLSSLLNNDKEDDFSAFILTIRELDSVLKSILGLLDEMIISTLSRAAFIDSLTGLYSRNYLRTVLLREVSLSKRKNIPLSLILIDVDHFKKINDTYGHDVGDQVLRSVGMSLRKLLRLSDIPVRYGGEEFLILLPYTSEEGAHLVAERIRKHFENTPFENLGLKLKLTVSCGVAQVKNYENPEVDIKEADMALYMAKTLGRNRVEVAGNVF